MLELFLLAAFLVAWCVALVLVAAGLPLAGAVPLSLYQLYGVAAFAGWLSGNVYVQRARGLPPKLKRRVWLIYFLGPPSVVYLLRTMAPAAAQAAAPLAGLWAFGVFAIFFLVPLTLRARPPAAGRRS